MKEKIVKILKYIERKNIKRKLCILFVSILSLYWLVFIYSLIYEQDKMNIDRYNFEQLNVVKETLSKIDRKSYNFYDLKHFNNKYDQNIKPINNCYYLVSTNNFDEYDQNKWIWYIFWFKLESLIYKFMYFWVNYAYPKYDLPVAHVCDGGNKCDYDSILANFIWTITNPCRD